jgi:aldehyde:ferredoxin oxidoreductase
VDVLTCKNNHVFVIIISTPFHLRVAILSTDDYSTSSVYRVSNGKTETHRRQIRILGINIAAARLVRVARRLNSCAHAPGRVGWF